MKTILVTTLLALLLLVVLAWTLGRYRAVKKYGRVSHPGIIDDFEQILTTETDEPLEHFALINQHKKNTLYQHRFTSSRGSYDLQYEVHAGRIVAIKWTFKSCESRLLDAGRHMSRFGSHFLRSPRHA